MMIHKNTCLIGNGDIGTSISAYFISSKSDENDLEKINISFNHIDQWNKADFDKAISLLQKIRNDKEL
jgi:hypothetical protein